MLFWLQREEPDKELDIDIRILLDELHKQKYIHTYEFMSLDQVLSTHHDDSIIPVGTVEFVGAYLAKKYGIANMNPIEVPDVLREDQFLKRKYSIVAKEELPKSGYYFTKYVSKLKVFSHTGRIETLQFTDIGVEPYLQDGLYQVSEVVPILSEYRCFVQGDNIKVINYYDGDCTVLPDITTVQKMVNYYMKDVDRPKAYTMDIAVIDGRGTALLEVHPWVSVGLYGYMFGSYLPYCYRDGLDYYITTNKEVTPFSNF